MILDIFKKNKKDAFYFRRRSVGEKIIFALVFLMFSIYSFTVLYVFYWTINGSLMSSMEFYLDPLSLTQTFRLKNYVEAFTELKYGETNYFGMLINSAWYTVGTSVITVFFSSLTGYVFAKYNFKLKKTLLIISLLTMILPVMGTLPALYNLIFALNLADSPLFLVTKAGGLTAGGFLFAEAFFRSIDNSYSEAAFIDGAGHWKVFFAIMMPMAKAIILSSWVTNFIVVWNDFYNPMMFLEQMPTLAYGLYAFRVEVEYSASYPLYFAGVVISMLPIVILFIAFNRIIVGSVVSGGLKG